MEDFKSQAFANTAWAFATAGRKDESLFAALATAAHPRMDDFDSKSLASTAWALMESAACALESCQSKDLGGRCLDRIMMKQYTL